MTRPADAPRPLYFGPAAQRLFGWYHPPRAPLRAGVVICNPLGYEEICAYRALRHLAERLAGAGLAVLRFDYHGTGDSSGDDRDPARLPAWLDGIGAAIDELRRVAGVTEVSLFGLRMGALLAGLAAEARRDVASLVLWSPCVSGKAHMREVRAFRLLAARELELEGGAAADAPGPLAEGDEDAAGFVFTAETAAALKQVDLLSLKAAPARVLVLARDDSSREDGLAAHLRTLGAAVEQRVVPGYADMMVDPHKSVLPGAVFAAVVGWLSAVHAPLAKPAPLPAAAVSPLLELDVGGVAVRERPLFFGDAERLFAIVTEPATAPPTSRVRRPALLLLNAGAVHHVGSNRMYVTMARAWAALGFTVLRLDIAGIGDSRVAAGVLENVTYSTTAVPDVAAAMEALRRTRGIDRFVLGGLCSGAYVAFHAGLAGLPVAGTVLINPQTFYYKEGDPLDVSVARNFREARHYRQALFDRTSWAKALRGEVNFRYIFDVLRRRARIVAAARLQPLWRLAGGAAPEDVAHDLRATVERGIDTCFVFSAGDPGLGYLDLHARAALRELRGRANFRLEVIDGADHTFTPPWSQERLREIITRHVVQRYT